MWWTGMIIMILGAFIPQLGELWSTHVLAGEICNFAAYAFVEAIVVVRRFSTLSKRYNKNPYLCPDPHGCIIRRDIRHPVPHRPQREIVSLRLDWFYSMYPWGLHPSS